MRRARNVFGSGGGKTDPIFCNTAEGEGGGTGRRDEGRRGQKACRQGEGGPHLSSNRTEYPTRPPRSTPISWATRLATVMAATRRGCVQATAP